MNTSVKKFVENKNNLEHIFYGENEFVDQRGKINNFELFIDNFSFMESFANIFGMKFKKIEDMYNISNGIKSLEISLKLKRK